MAAIPKDSLQYLSLYQIIYDYLDYVWTGNYRKIAEVEQILIPLGFTIPKNWPVDVPHMEWFIRHNPWLLQVPDNGWAQ